MVGGNSKNQTLWRIEADFHNYFFLLFILKQYFSKSAYHRTFFKIRTNPEYWQLWNLIIYCHYLPNDKRWTRIFLRMVEKARRAKHHIGSSTLEKHQMALDLLNY
jgi:hypothetical protein